MQQVGVAPAVSQPLKEGAWLTQLHWQGHLCQVHTMPAARTAAVVHNCTARYLRPAAGLADCMLQAELMHTQPGAGCFSLDEVAAQPSEPRPDCCPLLLDMLLVCRAVIPGAGQGRPAAQTVSHSVQDSAAVTAPLSGHEAAD